MRGCRVLRYSSWSGATLGACVPYPPGQGAPTPPSGLGFYGTPACEHGIHRHVWSHQIDCGSGTSIGPLDDSLNMPKVLEVGLGALGTLAAVVVILMALRMAPKLSLSAHRLAVRIFVAAVLFVVASALVGVSVAFTRPSTLADAAGEFAELVTICCMGFALRVINRAEREEISPLETFGEYRRPDRLEQSVVLSAGGGAANPAIAEKRHAPHLRRARRRRLQGIQR